MNNKVKEKRRFNFRTPSTIKEEKRGEIKILQRKILKKKY